MRYIFLLLLLLAPAAHAVQPGEMLDDPVLEARARDISQDLRCLVCQNENIDDSNADLARDLRLLVRELLVAGNSDAEVKAALVARYGEFVLLRPTTNGANIILWWSGPALLLMGLGLSIAFIRRRPKAATAGLSTDEENRLTKLMADD